jgi:PRC-barrel domain protein
MNSNLRFLAASRVDTPAGRLRDALVLSQSETELGKLNGILVDPAERRLCYFVVESGHWPSRREHLIPAGFARMEPTRKTLYVDVDPDRSVEYEECRSDRLPAFSDEDLISAMFATQETN